MLEKLQSTFRKFSTRNHIIITIIVILGVGSYLFSINSTSTQTAESESELQPATARVGDLVIYASGSDTSLKC